MAEACTRFRELTQINSSQLPPDAALIDLAKCLLVQGEERQALDAYQQILDDYPGSIFAADARRSLQELEPG